MRRCGRGRAGAGVVSRRALIPVATVVLVGLGVVVGCRAQDPSRSAAGDEPEAGVREEVLAALADCAVVQAREFGARAAALVEFTREQERTPTEDARDAARAAWSAAMDQWQESELFQFGPAATRGQPGGQDLRAQIYIWPQFNRCLIEQLMARGTYLEADFAAQFANARGLAAVEYALHYGGEDNACPASNPINSSGSWAALVAGGLDRAKAGYARAAAEDVRRHADALASAWDPARGGFRDELARAGRGSAEFATARAGVNVVSDALFYLDTVVKDQKLGAPLGLHDCAATTCFGLVESPFAGRSTAHVRSNLLGFQRLFSGCAEGEGLAFDDLLVAMGQGGLAAEMARATEAAIVAADAIEESSLVLAVTVDVESVQRLHAAVKAITDLLKTEFVTALSLQLPSGAAGDND